MNLTTAIIVEQAITAGREDRWIHQSQNRRKVKQFKPFLEAIFEALDSSENGTLSRAEIKNGMTGIVEKVRDKKFGHGMPEEIKDIVVSDRFVGLFDVLDADDSGTISKEEPWV